MAFALALGWGRSDDELIRHVALFRLMGAQNVRWFFEAGGLFALLMGMAALRRLLGNGVAAAIRDDGIQFNSVFVSRFIRWRDLDRVRLDHWQGWRGSRHQVLRAETSSGRRDISVSLLRAPDTEIAQWIKAANEARAKGFSPQIMRGRAGRI
jgi:hypothetical protein